MAPSRFHPRASKSRKKVNGPKRKSGWISAFARFYRLQIIPQLMPWRRTQETAKVVIYHNYGIAFLHSLVHLAPMLIVLVLIGYNGNGHFIGDVSTTAITAIQFAAKALEILLQASLVAMLYGIIRYFALTEGLLPLGTLFAPLNITSLSYLWSLELWGSMTAECLRGWRRVVICIMVPIAIGLAALVGPSSAVLMIPRQVHYPVGTDLVLMDPDANLFPSYYNASPNTIRSYPALQYSLDQLSKDGVVTQILNDDVGIRVPIIQYPEWTSIPSRRIAQLFENGPMNIGPVLNTIETHQPLVSIDCSDYLPSNAIDGTYLSFGAFDEPELQNLISVADLDQQGASELLPDLGGIGFMNHTTLWLDPPKGTSANYSLLFAEKQSGPERNYTSVTGCIIRAYWVEASIKYNTSASIVESTLKKKPTSAYNKDDLKQRVDWTTLGTTLAIAPDSARALAQLYYEQPRVANSTKGFVANDAAKFLTLGLSDGVPDGQMCTESVEDALKYTTTATKVRRGQSGGFFATPMTQCLTSGQLVSLSQLLKQQKLGHDRAWLTVSVAQNGTDPSQFTQLALQRYDLGYGYDNATVPVRLSMAALSLYCLLVVIYLAIMFPTGRSSSSWDTVSELFMLGVNSKLPAHLGNTSVGVETMGTFREPVSIRVLEGRSVIVAFDNDAALVGKDLREVVPNEKY